MVETEKGTLEATVFPTPCGVDFIDTPGVKIPLELSEADSALALTFLNSNFTPSSARPSGARFLDEFAGISCWPLLRSWTRLECYKIAKSGSEDLRPANTPARTASREGLGRG